jgi:hypothetical protein
VSNTASVIPAFLDNHQWSACFGLSWTDLMLHDQAGPGHIIRPGGMYLREVCGTMGVAAGRSEVVRKFLATGADWLFMVDTDMGFAPDTVSRLIASATTNATPVLGALCFALKRDTELAPAPFYGQRFRIVPTLYSFHNVEETGEKGFRSINRYRRDAHQHVAGTGAACLLMHRDALEAVGPDPFAPMAIRGGGGNGTDRTFSEDLSFCVRVAAAGIGLGVDTSIKTTHHKGGLFLDETAYAMQQETLIQAKGHEIAAQARMLLKGRP